MEQTKQPETAQAFCNKQVTGGLAYEADFVPWSQSRNAHETRPSLNWRVALWKGPVSLITDYMQGVGHIPNYRYDFKGIAVYDDAVRKVCETGYNTLTRAVNAYDATRDSAVWPRRKKLPAPKLVDVLYSLVMDAEVLEYISFESWAEELGFDPDSRKAERTYRQCIEHSLTLRQMIDLDAARDAFMDY